MARRSRKVTKSGYVLVPDVDGIYGVVGAMVPEHRLIMARMIGRPLTSDEFVHHADKNKANNDPLNLMIVDAHTHGLYHMGKRGRHKQPPMPPSFEGKIPWLKMKCPECGRVFYKPKSVSVLGNPNRTGLNYCCGRCATRFQMRLEEGNADLQRAKEENIICEFRTNGPFMKEFLSSSHRHWSIDDRGVFHG